MVVVAVVVQMGLATTRYAGWASLWWSDWVIIENSVSRLSCRVSFPQGFSWAGPGFGRAEPVGAAQPIIPCYEGPRPSPAHESLGW